LNRPVLNKWQGYSLTELEKLVLIEITMREFDKPKHVRCNPNDLLRRTLNVFNKSYKGPLNYEPVTGCKRKGE
jgi:hypothetical protein